MQAHNRNLSEWLNRVSTGQLKLPRFQRFEAWNHERVRNLLQTVLQGLPAGAALILEIGENEPFISRPVVGAPMPTERVTEHLLDGQQRITALWRSLNDNYDERTYFVYFDEQAGPKKPLVFGQPRWDRGGKRYPVWADDIGEIYRKGYIPLRLLRPMEIGKELADWCKNAVGNNFDDLAALSFRITELREKCATFNLPYLSLSAGTPKDTAIDVFIQMNTSAAPLSAFDIVVAQVEGVAGKSLHELVESIKTSAPAVESYAEPSDLVLGVAALREDHPPTTASYLSLDLQKLVSEWDQVVSGIAFATEFLEQERVFDGERLPTSAILPLLAALKSTMPKALDSLGQARTLLRQYVWRSFVTDRYENAAATRALQDFRGLRSVILESKLHSVVPIFSAQEYPLPTIEELKRSGWPKKRDILGRGILTVSLRGGAWDIADGTPVTRTNLNDREYHHLFPDALISSLAEGQCDSFLPSIVH